MSNGKKTLLIVAALVMLVVGGYKWRYPTDSWHQKLTIEIETPQGVVTGSSIVGVSWSKVPKLLPDMHSASNEISGEATVVDLGNGKYLFALLKGTSTLAQRTVVSRSAGPAANAWFYHASRVRSHLGKPAIIKSNQIPMLVTFDDINDPKTVKRVDTDDLDASFVLCPDGSGLADANAPWRAEKVTYKKWLAERARQGDEYQAEIADGSYSGVVLENILKRSYKPRNISTDCHRLQSITLEITDEPVTKGVVEKILKWWPKMRAGPYNSFANLRLPDDSPRRWRNLGALSFWSLDRLKELKEKAQ